MEQNEWIYTVNKYVVLSFSSPPWSRCSMLSTPIWLAALSTCGTSKHPRPRAIHQITARCYSWDSPVTPVWSSWPIISQNPPLLAVVKWPRNWTGRSNHHFTGTLVEALSSLSWRKPHSRLLTSAIFLLYRRRKGGRIGYAAIFSFQESSFCEAPTDSRILLFSRFHCDCGFLLIAFCLSVHWWILEH